MNHISRAFVLFALSIAILATGQALAQSSFVEDFTTTTNFSPSANNADWDTVAGELRLFPLTPTILGAVDMPGAARKVTLSGHYAYVSDGYSGVQVVDISNAGAPVIVAAVNTPGYAYQVDIAGTYAYVADHSGGLRVLDISQPTAPVAVASLATSDVAVGLTVNGNYAYLGCGAAGVIVADISDPLAPTTVATFNTNGDAARNIAIHGNYAFVTDGDGGMLVLDITDPTAPLAVDGYGGSGYVHDLELRGDLLYLSVSGSGLDIVDISDPTGPALLGSVAVSGTLRGVDIVGDRVFLARDGLGLAVIDVSDPAQPVVVEQITTPGNAYDVYVRGENAYVADQGPGLQIIQIAEYVKPLLLQSNVYTNCIGAPVVSGSLIFCAGGFGGLEILDASDPTAPISLNSYDVGGPVNGIALAGDLAFLSMGDSRLVIVDISDPVALVTVGQLNTPTAVGSVTVSGDYAYLAVGSLIRVADISDPSVPLLVGSFNATDSFNKIAVAGDFAIPYGYSGTTLELVDISDPAAPVLHSTISLTTPHKEVAFYGDVVLVAGGTSLVSVDISNPAAPVEVNAYSYFSSVKSMSVVGDRAYVGDETELWAMSLSDPSAPGYGGRTTITDGLVGRCVAMGEYVVMSGYNSWTVKILQASQHEVDTDRRWADSTLIAAGQDPLIKVRLNAVVDGTVKWAVATGGAGVDSPVIPGVWMSTYDNTPELLWTVELQYAPGTMSTVSELTIEWLHEHANIEVVTDVANDQGRQVSLEWVRSAYDFVGEANQIVEYAVYREIDPNLAAKTTAPVPVGASQALRENMAAMKGAGWHYVTSVPVLVEDFYGVVVPTLGDSTATGGTYESTFKVVALTATPGVYFTSPPAVGVSVDNLAPGVPLNLAAAYQSDNVTLDWDDAEDEDFRYFRVYRGAQLGFVPSAGTLVSETTGSQWVDNTPGTWTDHYKVTAVDFGGNESPAATVETASDVPDAGPVLTLGHAVPNPFNPSTTISYSLPRTGHVKLVVCDVSGREIKTLVDESQAAGSQQVVWHGTDRHGRTVASGVYFYRLHNGSETLAKRVVLLK